MYSHRYSSSGSEVRRENKRVGHTVIMMTPPDLVFWYYNNEGKLNMKTENFHSGTQSSSMLKSAVSVHSCRE